MNSLTAFVISIGALLASLIALAFWADSVSCPAKWSAFGPTRYGLMEECMVQINGRWTPAKAIRVDANGKPVN